MLLGAFGIGISLVACLSYIPEMTQELVGSVNELAIKIENIIHRGPSNDMVQTEQGEQLSYYALVKGFQKKFESFEGFNVLDFFILRRSLLTSILTQFITYCIVLFQFKISEK